MDAFEQQGYELVRFPELDDERVMSLIKAMGKLLSAQEERHNFIDSLSTGLREVKSLLALSDTNNQAASSVAWAIFKGDAPQLFVEFIEHNDATGEAGADYITLRRLHSFDGFLLSPEGRETGQAVMDRIFGGDSTSHKPYITLGEIPDNFFDPYLRSHRAA
jgi:hypothetical protein